MKINFTDANVLVARLTVPTMSLRVLRSHPVLCSVSAKIITYYHKLHFYNTHLYDYFSRL